jgi:quercetin dioxygenase-like cupin family protein
MQPTRFILGLGVTLGLVAGGIGSQGLHAQQPPVKRTILQRVDLAGMEGKEGVMYVAEIAPGAQSGRHFHPGPEFIYIQEGSMVLESDGEAPVTMNAGDSRHMPARHVHNGRNVSTTTPTKVVVFLLAEKGQPLTTPVDQPVAQQSPAAGGTSGAAATQPGSSTSSGAASSGAHPSTSPK